MILPADDLPIKPRCSTCHAEYKSKQPFAHRAGCSQMGRASTEATMVMPAPKQPAPGLAAEVALAERMNDAGLVGWEPQHFWALDERSAKGRPVQYRSDFAFVKARVLVESEGGAHTVRRQHEADCRRASLAAALGWRMVRVTKDMIVDGSAVALIARALNNNAPAGEGGS